MPDPLEPGQRVLVARPVVRRDCGDPGARDDAGGHDGPLVLAAEQVVGEQHRDLVAAQPAPGAVVADADRQPVGVGVVGQHEVRVTVVGQGEREVQRAGLLGVGEADGRERAVRLVLLGHGRDVLDAGACERVEDDRPTNAVQRGVDDPNVAACRIGVDALLELVEVAATGVGAELLDEVVRPRVVDHRDVTGRRGPLDQVGDVGIGGRHDLDRVDPVHLVAVVLRRVVAGRDHDRTGGVGLASGPGHERCRGRFVPAQHAPTRRNRDGDDVSREPLRVRSCVVADAQRLVVVSDRRQVLQQRPGRPDHGGPVHAARARTDTTAKTRRAERKWPRHRRPELGEVVAVQCRLELVAGRHVGISVDPRPRCVPELLVVHVASLPSARR